MKTRPPDVGEQIASQEPAGGVNQLNVVGAGCGDSTTSKVEHSPTIIAQTSANKPPRLRFSLEEKQALESTLLLNAKLQLPQLKELLNQVENEWGIEDGVYRFYHGSYKVYDQQVLTLEICKVLEALLPSRTLNAVFRGIVADGTGRTIEDSQDKDWPNDTRPIVEALFHAHYFLKMTCKYAEELDAPSEALPSGWAAVLYLYNLRDQSSTLPAKAQTVKAVIWKRRDIFQTIPNTLTRHRNLLRLNDDLTFIKQYC